MVTSRIRASDTNHGTMNIEIAIVNWILGVCVFVLNFDNFTVFYFIIVSLNVLVD